MDVDRLQSHSARFRSALDALSPKLGLSFCRFPLGACADSSLLLGTYLAEQGFGAFHYMLGSYGDEFRGNFSSHAWLQQGELIVDVTADQFPDITAPVIVTHNSHWHRMLRGERHHIADYRRYGASVDAELAPHYALICQWLQQHAPDE